MQVETLHKMKVTDLAYNEYYEFYQTYISKVNDQLLNDGLVENKETIVALLDSISDDKFKFAYDVGKWTIKELVQHIIDTERIFAIRALRIARNDRTSLPGFDQDEFNQFSGANNRTKQELIEDYIATRNNTIALFNSFSIEMLLRIGIASDHELSARAAGFIIIGHENHHVQILRERYL